MILRKSDMDKRSAILGAILLWPPAAMANEEDYTLLCNKEADWSQGERPILKSLKSPFIAKIKFTGTESRISSRHPELRGQITTYDDLTLELKGSAMKGGAVRGSTYDASSIYDTQFLRTGFARTTWGYSKHISAWTLQHDGKSYVCVTKR